MSRFSSVRRRPKTSGTASICASQGSAPATWRRRDSDRRTPAPGSGRHTTCPLRSGPDVGGGGVRAAAPSEARPASLEAAWFLLTPPFAVAVFCVVAVAASRGSRARTGASRSSGWLPRVARRHSFVVRGGAGGAAWWTWLGLASLPWYVPWKAVIQIRALLRLRTWDRWSRHAPLIRAVPRLPCPTGDDGDQAGELIGVGARGGELHQHAGELEHRGERRLFGGTTAEAERVGGRVSARAHRLVGGRGPPAGGELLHRLVRRVGGGGGVVRRVGRGGGRDHRRHRLGRPARGHREADGVEHRRLSAASAASSSSDSFVVAAGAGPKESLLGDREPGRCQRGEVLEPVQREPVEVDTLQAGAESAAGRRAPTRADRSGARFRRRRRRRSPARPCPPAPAPSPGSGPRSTHAAADARSWVCCAGRAACAVVPPRDRWKLLVCSARRTIAIPHAVAGVEGSRWPEVAF